jgi:hypothetical protein
LPGKVHHPFTPKLAQKFQIMAGASISEKLQFALSIAIAFVPDNH